ncbi:AarF/UbiB family protein [uncultured Limosilactobacillus sp.]|uniref:AarF/UbiB family protein n=1 Tax=uncultured Limosilactobacillus sp. TaxID=2837629 RepID=UPI002595F06C|nr:AarF/UbiB family protein [uncultured Limosilactobacillus sp.]
MTSETDIEIKKGQRLREIMQVMRRHHFLSNFYHQKNPEEVVAALQELGPTFIKMGQILSTRPDLIPPAYVKALRKLQDQVKADPFASVQATFKAQTGHTIDEVFASFDPQPFASASIGQVHHATLKDGTPVVVKVQHPAVGQLVNTDIALLRRAVKLFQYVPNEVTVVNLDKVLDELSRSLLSEVNTLNEVHNGEEFYRLNNSDDIITVPKVYAKYCAPQILVNEAMAGKSVRHLFPQNSKDNDDPQLPTQRKYIAHVLAQNFMKQVFVDHFFHADPHPGNILVHELDPADEDAATMKTTHQHQAQVGKTTVGYREQTALPPYRIVYLDFGMMGVLTPAMADGIANVILAITTKNVRRIAQAVLAICNQTGPLDELAFTKELGSFIRPYLAMGVGEIDFTAMLYSIVQLCQRNHLQMKPEVTLLIKAFGTLESTVARLDPDISMMEVARPFGLRYLKRKFNWRDSLDDQLISLVTTAQETAQLPDRINATLETIANGDAQVNFKLKGQDSLIKQVERITNRFLIVIILAAVILGSSVIVEGSSQHPHIFRLGVIGYSIALVVIVALVLSELGHRWRNWRNKNK